MADDYEEILAQVRSLLDEGKSLAITTIDTPWGHGEPASVDGDFVEHSIFKSQGGRRCVQWVVLPSGEVKCARYRTD